MPNRRVFLQRVAAGAAAFGLPLALAERAFGKEAPALPPTKLFSSDPDRYWAELRRQWLLAADHVNLNCGSVGCTPLPVLNAMIDHLLSAEAFREPAYPWFGYEENPRLRELRDALAAYLHCKRDELALEPELPSTSCPSNPILPVRFTRQGRRLCAQSFSS